MKTVVITKNYIEGFHCYPDAPSPVSFLRQEHRHVFHVECGLAVNGDNREVEIFTRQDQVAGYFSDTFGTPARFGSLSCEAISRLVLEAFEDCDHVKILEDGEGGAIVQG